MARKNYSRELKNEITEYVKENSVKAASEKFKVTESLIYGWLRKSPSNNNKHQTIKVELDKDFVNITVSIARKTLTKQLLSDLL